MIRVLLIHNQYKQYGGEDATLEAEKILLESNGNVVETLLFTNKKIDGYLSRIKAGIQLFYSIESAILTERKIRAFSPHIIHVHNFVYSASPSVFYVGKRFKIPVVVTLHNYRLICSGSLLLRDQKPCNLCVNQKFPFAGIKYKCHRKSRIETALVTFMSGVHKLLNTWQKQIDCYIALTEFAKNIYVNSSLKLTADKIVVKPNSVADSEFDISGNRDPFFLYLGRLSEEKGITTLLTSFKNSKHVIEIVGDGPLRSLVENEAKTNSNIIYHGYRNKSFIISRLKRTSALIVPSIWYECLPITILEAFSTGTPIIISDLGNLNEIVTNGYNGLHFRTNDPIDLLNKINDFILNHENYLMFYENARKTYLSKYTPDLNYKNLMTIYSSLILRNA